MTELEQYKKLVEGLADTKSKAVFSNGRSEHAAIIFETFFKFAKHNVSIFCQNLAANVFELKSVVERLEMALLKGVKVMIITQEEPESTELVRQIGQWKQNKCMKIELVVAKDQRIKCAPVNFAVMDGRAYRFEPDRKVPIAYACMNAPENSRALEDKFLRYMAASV